MTEAALIGKAGEAIVAGELMRRGVSVAYPAYDGGIDLIAYKEHGFGKVVPIQVKARSETLFNFQKSWFRIPGVVLVQVWHTRKDPKCYIFSSIHQVIGVLDGHAETESWIVGGGYRVGDPTAEHMRRMAFNLNRWDLITKQLE
ncbi:MAG TPA: hypothetical protein VKS60_18035 [Stellaceae bacterium]|nr:hypothetical protein [Stellaceae bacterium]